jgi:hypothetical protein
MAKYMESRESSSPIITRAVSVALKGQESSAYEFDMVTKAALKAVGYFPQTLAQWLIPRAPNANALEGSKVRELKIDDLIRVRLGDYRDNKGPFPTVTMGVGMGGTTAHLAANLGGPFLPQAFVMTLKHGSMDGDVEKYFHLSADIAREVTDNNPDVMSIQHYDPVHDGWLVRRVNHLRLKLIDLPVTYKEYIRANLAKGGEVIYLEGKANWKQYKVGERNVFQVGGWGDIPDTEFLEGSPRIKSYCMQERITKTDWRLMDYPLMDGYESEWGSEPGLGEAVEAFCRNEGYRFTKISFNDPNDFSILNYLSAQRLLEMDGREAAGVLVETFSQYDVSSVRNTGLLPLWLIFNTTDSVRFLADMAKHFPKGKPVFFSPLSTFSLTPDMATWSDWENALKGTTWVNVGTRKSHYPADTWTLIEWQSKLKEWCRQNSNPVKSCLTGEILKQLAKQVK